jgi:DNA-binding NarL/FixJ family response regulator
MQSCLCSLPVLILSSSDRISDIQAAYEKGVNGYLVKPASPKDLDAMIQALKGFWLTFNRTVPTNEAAIGQAAN